MFLEISNLSYSYGTQHILQNVSFSLEEGAFLLVCGETGCGKTTLLRLLKPELWPEEGQAEGRILLEGSPLQKKQYPEIGFVMQRPEQQMVTDYVWHELAFGLENMGLPTEEIRRRTAEIAAYFDMESWFEQQTDTLSGGQKQQLALASVLVMGSKLLLLDEPTSQLDPVAASQFFSVLDRLRRELGLTVIIVEHRMEELFAAADQVLFLKDGGVGAFGTPGEVAMKLAEDGDAFMQALPKAFQITEAVMRLRKKGGLPLPLTVREGRAYLKRFGITRKEAEECCASALFSAAEKGDVGTTIEKVVMLSHVSCFYGDRQVLADVSFQARPGECVAIVGGNGAGKTTLLKKIAGLLPEKASLGKMVLFGEKCGKHGISQEILWKTGLLMQDVQTLFTEESVEEDLNRYEAFLQQRRKDGISGVGTWQQQLPAWGFGTLLQKQKLHPYDLSGGEQQMLGLAKILLREPELLLLDEPGKGMDAVAKEKLKEILQEQKKQGRTILLVTHDLNFAEGLADRAVMLFRGGIAAEGEVEEFFRQNLFYTTATERLFRRNTVIQEKEGCEK